MLQWLISVNVIVSLALWIASLSGNFAGLTTPRLYSWFALSSDPHVFLSHPWTLLTYMFAQYGLLHLLFNLIWLFCFGRIAVIRCSDKDLAWLYIGGGILGGLAYMAVSWSGLFPVAPGSYLCGSSASVISVMTAAGIMLSNMEVRLFLIGNVRVKWLTLVCIVLTFLGLGSSAGSISAHAGGLIFGAVYAVARNKNFSFRQLFRGPGFSKSRVAPSNKGIKRNASAVAKAAKGRLCDNDRLDQLLDKMKSSGFESLSKSEQNELHAISARLRKNGPSKN